MTKGSIEAKGTITGHIATAIGLTPDIAIGEVVTLEEGQNAYVELADNSSIIKPIFKFGIPKGNTGDKGATGQAGAEGHTPVKGVDYWTEAEQNEIKTHCDEYIDTQIIQAIGGEY